MWDLIVLLISGAIIGWAATYLTGSGSNRGLLTNIIVGIVGAFLARWLFGSVFNIDSATLAGSMSWAGIGWGILGSIVLLFLLQLGSYLMGGSDGNRRTLQP